MLNGDTVHQQSGRVNLLMRARGSPLAHVSRRVIGAEESVGLRILRTYIVEWAESATLQWAWLRRGIRQIIEGTRPSDGDEIVCLR